MNTLTLQKTLGYLGVLPFFIAAAGVLLSIPLFQLDAREVFVAYSSVILSFLAGTLWGRCLGSEQKQSHSQEFALLLSSNALALAAWLCLLLSHSSLALLILMLGFFTVLLVERDTNNPFKHAYRRLRIQLTTVVVLLHGLLLVG